VVKHCSAFAVGLSLSTVLLGAPLFAQYEGWTVPATAKTEKNPMAGSADAVKKGKTVYEQKCRRCHGADGKGKGPEADPKVPPADLTAIEADVNPDGVLFYKIWNGRAGVKGSMPNFKVQLVRDDVWRVVEYVKTLK
jgi:mono/diheme cytochrome c family protein